MKPLLTASICALMAAGCASSRSYRNDGLSRPADLMVTSTGEIVRPSTLPPAAAVLEATPDRVFLLLPAVYAELGIGGEILDSRARTYGVQRVAQPQIAGRRTAELVRCGFSGGPSATAQQRIRLSVVSRVFPEAEGKARLTTEVSGNATSVSGASNDPVPCVSSGEIEARIQQLTAEKLSQPATGS